MGQWRDALEGRLGLAMRRVIGRAPLVTVAPMQVTFHLHDDAEVERLIVAVERAAFARSGPAMGADQIRTLAAERLAVAGLQNRKITGESLRVLLDLFVSVAETASKDAGGRTVESVPDLATVSGDAG